MAIIIISLPQSTAGHRPLQSLAISLDLRLLASSSCQLSCANRRLSARWLKRTVLLSHTLYRHRGSHRHPSYPNSWEDDNWWKFNQTTTYIWEGDVLTVAISVSFYEIQGETWCEFFYSVSTHSGKKRKIVRKSNLAGTDEAIRIRFKESKSRVLLTWEWDVCSNTR
jgi:hypothetical protein